jgi:hypothetical protein
LYAGWNGGGDATSNRRRVPESRPECAPNAVAAHVPLTCLFPQGSYQFLVGAETSIPANNSRRLPASDIGIGIIISSATPAGLNDPKIDKHRGRIALAKSDGARLALVNDVTSPVAAGADIVLDQHAGEEH